MITFTYPESVVQKAYKAYKDAPIPGSDAMSAALNAVKNDIAQAYQDEVDVQKIINSA
jgi:hypothetical protein